MQSWTFCCTPKALWYSRKGVFEEVESWPQILALFLTRWVTLGQSPYLFWSSGSSSITKVSWVGPEHSLFSHTSRLCTGCNLSLAPSSYPFCLLTHPPGCSWRVAIFSKSSPTFSLQTERRVPLLYSMALCVPFSPLLWLFCLPGVCNRTAPSGLVYACSEILSFIQLESSWLPTLMKLFLPFYFVFAFDASFYAFYQTDCIFFCLVWKFSILFPFFL